MAAATQTSPDTSSLTDAPDVYSDALEGQVEQPEVQEETKKEAELAATSPRDVAVTQDKLESSSTQAAAHEPTATTTVDDPVVAAAPAAVPAATTPSAAAATEIRPAAPSTIVRQASEALGPAADSAVATPAPTTATTTPGPTLNISLMLTTGARHPYRVDEKYVRNRNVTAVDAATGHFDPRELSGYQLKELIWTDWRAEWEPRPASPSSIRLILMGRMLDDKAALRDYPFNLANVNVVHMTVKPADLPEDDEAGAGKAGKAGILRVRDGEDRGAGCRCVIQ